MNKKTKFKKYFTSKVQVGDVIQSEKFVNLTISRPNPPKSDVVSRADSSIANAKFVVETASLQGGCGDYPDGWFVSARKLKDNGAYDPQGIEIGFYQSGCFIGVIERIQVVGKMKMMFVKVD
jgi:hypothetical protein